MRMECYVKSPERARIRVQISGSLVSKASKFYRRGTVFTYRETPAYVAYFEGVAGVGWFVEFDAIESAKRDQLGLWAAFNAAREEARE